MSSTQNSPNLDNYRENYNGSLPLYTATAIKAYRMRNPQKVKEWGASYYERNKQKILWKMAKKRYLKRIEGGHFVSDEIKEKYELTESEGSSGEENVNEEVNVVAE